MQGLDFVGVLMEEPRYLLLLSIVTTRVSFPVPIFHTMHVEAELGRFLHKSFCLFMPLMLRNFLPPSLTPTEITNPKGQHVKKMKKMNQNL